MQLTIDRTVTKSYIYPIETKQLNKRENIMKASELKKGDKLTNTNHGFEIEIVEIGKKNIRYINLETGEKVKSFTSKFDFMLREGVFTL